MIRKPLYLLVTFLLYTTVTHAASTLQANPADTDDLKMSPLISKETAEAIKREEWISKLRAYLPKMLCKPKGLVRNCYLIEEGQCNDFAKTISTACINSIEKRLPESLSSVEQKNAYKVVKACAYDLFEKLLSDKQVPYPECRDMGNKVIAPHGQPDQAKPHALTAPLAPMPPTMPIAPPQPTKQSK